MKNMQSAQSSSKLLKVRRKMRGLRWASTDRVNRAAGDRSERSCEEAISSKNVGRNGSVREDVPGVASPSGDGGERLMVDGVRAVGQGG